MTRVHGTVRDGGVVLDAPVGVPDGTRVQISTIDDPDRIDIPEEEQGDGPESIANWLAWLEQLPVLALTDDDRERWRKARDEQKARELAQWEDRTARARKLFP